MGKPIVEVHDLTVSYDKKPVLWDIDFELPSGQLIGIIGPNGAGKSTLLKTIMGLVEPNSGFVKTWGEKIESCKKRIAYVPQRESVDWDFPASVLDIAVMGRYPHKGVFARINNDDRDKAFESLKKVRMHDFSNRQISQLSGGQQQRTFLARALTQDADLYLMDEPFAGVDITTEKEIISLLKELVSKGKTIVVVHHDLQTVNDYFDHILMINTALVAEGSTSEVFNETNLKDTYQGKVSFLNTIGDVIKEQEFPVRKG